MWEIALLIVSIGFLGLVVFTVPLLLQLRDSAKELEFTLHETRETIAKLREVVEKAEDGIDRGREIIAKAGHAVSAIDGVLGNRGPQLLGTVMGTALKIIPIVLTAKGIYQKFIAKRR
jgi:hypothetical protein